MISSLGSIQGQMPAFDTLWNYGDPAGTEQAFRQVLAQHESVAPAADVAELLGQIARCQGLQGHFDAAHLTLDRVEGMLTQDMARPKIRYLLERGRVFNSSGQPERALPLFEAAWELGQSAGQLRLALDALHMVAIAQADPADQIATNKKGIAFIEAHPAEQGWLPAYLNNLGESHALMGEYAEALAVFRRLDAFTLAQGKPVDLYTRKDMARMLRLLGHTEEALVLIQTVAEGLSQGHLTDGWIDEEFAECLLQAGRKTEARPLFCRAYHALREDAWVRQHDPAKLQRLQSLCGGPDSDPSK